VSLNAREQLEVVSEVFGGAFRGLLVPLVYVTCGGIFLLLVLKFEGCCMVSWARKT